MGSERIWFPYQIAERESVAKQEEKAVLSCMQYYESALWFCAYIVLFIIMNHMNVTWISILPALIV